MGSIKDYLSLSRVANDVKSMYTNGKDISLMYAQIKPTEEESLIRHFLTQNTPFLFKDKPMLFEQIIKYICDLLEVKEDEVKLIGSAKTGFSISSDNYGKSFFNGDLDFAIYSQKLFVKLKNEYDKIIELENLGELGLKPKVAEYWNENRSLIAKNISAGFIQCNKIPYFSATPCASTIANLLWVLQTKLLEINKIEVAKPSLRVYETYDAFMNNLKLNTTDILKAIK